jgi:uncharacterized protein (DUF433 family)
MATSVDIGTLIFKDPALHSGRPCITGTGTTVLAIWSLAQEFDVDGILDQLEYLNRAQVYAALAYIAANEDEIRGYLEEDSRAYDEWERKERERRAGA